MNKAKTILVIGQSGQLGKSLSFVAPRYHGFDFFFVGRKQFDITDEAGMRTFFADRKFDIIINCAAYTSVDLAETDREAANIINNTAVFWLSEIARDSGARLIHISTDYVFDGKVYRPYREVDQVNPVSSYGKSKVDGENAILRTLPMNAIIVRTSWLYSEYGNNFLKTMLSLGHKNAQLSIVADQVGTPTYANDLAGAIMSIVQSELFSHGQFKSSIYHYSNEGVCSWFDFSKAIFELADVKCSVYPIGTNDYPRPAARPFYSVLSKNKIKKDFQLSIPHWRDSVKKCLCNLKEQVN